LIYYLRRYYAMHPAELEAEMDADKFAEFLEAEESRRELMGETFD
jgi:hypothetical protein